MRCVAKKGMMDEDRLYIQLSCLESVCSGIRIPSIKQAMVENGEDVCSQEFLVSPGRVNILLQRVIRILSIFNTYIVE